LVSVLSNNLYSLYVICLKDIDLDFDRLYYLETVKFKQKYIKYIYLRNNSTVLEELEVSIVDLTVANAVLLATRSGGCQLWIWRSQMQFYWRRETEPVKRIFTTVKSTIDTSNSSNTVLLFLFLWISPIKSTIDAVKFSNTIQLSPF
jgi:hypothetical protein